MHDDLRFAHYACAFGPMAIEVAVSLFRCHHHPRRARARALRQWHNELPSALARIVRSIEECVETCKSGAGARSPRQQPALGSAGFDRSYTTGSRASQNVQIPLAIKRAPRRRARCRGRTRLVSAFEAFFVGQKSARHKSIDSISNRKNQAFQGECRKKKGTELVQLAGAGWAPSKLHEALS